MENQLEPTKVIKNGQALLDKEGNEIYNLNLKTKVNKDGSITQGLTVGDSVVVEKVYEAKSTYGYAIKVKFKDKLCSFFVKDDEYDKYSQVGGVGDKVRVTAIAVPYTYKGEAKTKISFTFAKVE